MSLIPLARLGGEPLRSLALVTLALHGTAGYAADFNCSKAETKTERLICSSRETSILDEALGDAFYYRTHRSQATNSEKQRLRAEQRIWLRTVRDACPDLVCLNQTYTARLKALEPNNPELEWQTDGHWYMYSRSDTSDLARHPVMAFVSKDTSDALLSQFRGAGFWLSKQRRATRSEMAEMPQRLFSETALLCGNARVGIEDQGNGHYFDPLRTKVVIRNAQGRVVNAFAVFRELKPAKELVGVPKAYSHSGRLEIPISSAIYSVAALDDCTFLGVASRTII